MNRRAQLQTMTFTFIMIFMVVLFKGIDHLNTENRKDSDCLAILGGVFLDNGQNCVIPPEASSTGSVHILNRNALTSEVRAFTIKCVTDSRFSHLNERIDYGCQLARYRH